MSDDSSPASVSLLITNAQRAELKARLGMSDAEIDRMKPEEAHRLLGVQPSPKAGPRPVPLLGRDARDRFDELRDFMLRDLPHLWPAMEACLCACSVLRFKDRPTPLMLVLLGRSGSGKSTILDMLTLGKHWVICVLDDFTTASFLSQAEKAGGVSILDQLKYHAVVTSDLGSILRGKDRYASERFFSKLARVLDGKGTTTAGGYHGRLQLSGDYFFVWVAASTPLDDSSYRSMAAIGQRLLFMPMPESESVGLTKDETRGIGGYTRKVEEGQVLVRELFKAALPDPAAVRSLEWNEASDPEDVLDELRSLVNLLTIGRTVDGHEQEKGFRAYQAIADMMRARALLHGRIQISSDDLELARELVRGSMIPSRLLLIRALRAAIDGLNVSEVAIAARISDYKARQLMAEVVRLGLAIRTEVQRTFKAVGRMQTTKYSDAIRLSDEWRTAPCILTI